MHKILICHFANPSLSVRISIVSLRFYTHVRLDKGIKYMYNVYMSKNIVERTP